MQESVTVSIEGMHCGACVRRVTTALEGVAGVHPDVIEVGLAKMTFDPELVSKHEIAGAINRIGFVAHIIQT